MKITTYSVSQINGYLKGLIEDDVILGGFFLEAEISGFKPHSSGHCYFVAKDEVANINCIMFKTYAVQLGFVPENGMRVIMYGRLSVYEKTGQVQFYAEMMEPLGKGALFAAFEQLKNKLNKEGLFARKRTIPKNPACVAVVTSPTGAAVRDVISVCRRRNPNVAVVIIPALVQGDGAAVSIAAAMELVNLWGKADTLIVGRGGGSAEDLWAFNEEIVARAIFSSKIPVISAVGHETDFSIADFAADLRAATPSAAAEIAVPDVRTKTEYVVGLYDALNSAADSKIRVTKYKLRNVDSVNRAIDGYLAAKKQSLTRTMDKLHMVSPVNVLKRGYSLVYSSNGMPLVSVEQAVVNGDITIALKDGELTAKVQNVRQNVENAAHGVQNGEV